MKNTDVFLRKRKARFTWDYDLNAFRQVDRVVEKTSDLSPLLAAFEDILIKTPLEFLIKKFLEKNILFRIITSTIAINPIKVIIT